MSGTAAPDAILPSRRLYWLLPKEARNLVDCLGWELAVKILAAYGGTRLSIPTGKRPSKRRDSLVELVGEAGFEKLAGVFGGAPVPIPLCMEMQRERARALHRQGFSADAIAKRMGRDWTTIYRWIWQGEAAEDGPPRPEPAGQLNLFDE